MTFMKDLKNELNNEKQLTENGAVGYKTTGKALLDINFAASSLRNKNENEIYDKFTHAFYEDKLMAIKWLYFLRDVRGGMGERRSFRVILKHLAIDQPELVKELIPITAEYGRFDDLFGLLDTDLKEEVIKYCYIILLSDIKNVNDNQPISLLAKWLPSIKSKNDKYARMFADGFKMTKHGYSKTLKKLRRYLDIVECNMSENKWDKIEYSRVPSKANLLYRNAFMNHDAERRLFYLSSLANGETKINAGTLFPHDIVYQYCGGFYCSNSLNKYDESIEQLWKALPNYVSGDESTIVVADGSGSMRTGVGSKTNVTALEVANALAIYFSEKCTGEFKDKYITFSSRPQFVDMSNCESLREKVQVALKHSEVSNTDIYKVFKLILDTAIKNGYSQDELPKNILILSDMEFDHATCDRNHVTLFDKIENEYSVHGYQMPRLVFWNLCSRTNTIPVKENENGVALVSGFSPAIMQMVLSNKTDPYECLIEQLNVPRYDMVQKAYERYAK